MTELRIDLRIKGQRKTFTEDFVAYKKALDYTKGEEELFEKAKKNNEQPSAIDLAIFRADFVAGLFGDKEVTGEAILNGLDSEEKDKVMDIILYRVLGVLKEDNPNPKLTPLP